MENIIKEGQLAYDVSDKAKELFAVEGFNPREYLRESELKNGGTMTRLDVAVQVLWFQLCQEEGRIITIPHEISRERAIFQAQIYLDDSDLMKSNAYAACYISDDPDFGRSFIELAETFSIGRALKRAGFGSQFCDLAGINEPDPGETNGNGLEPSAENGTDSETTDKKSTNSKKDAAASKEQKPEPEPEEPKEYVPDETLSLEELTATMPVTYAMRIVIPFGAFTGKTLGQLSLEKPKSLEYYLKQANVSKTLKAGVQVLMNTALKKTG